jgi:tRNA-dihydrouridine synthase
MRYGFRTHQQYRKKSIHSKKNESDIVVSMKMRLGYDTTDEILAVLPILEKYDVKNVAVHARLVNNCIKEVFI